eukprot:359170-Chlamydomonas_euryale.AAC.3
MWKVFETLLGGPFGGTPFETFFEVILAHVACHLSCSECTALACTPPACRVLSPGGGNQGDPGKPRSGSDLPLRKSQPDRKAALRVQRSRGAMCPMGRRVSDGMLCVCSMGRRVSDGVLR